MRSPFRLVFIVALVWLGLWGFDRSLTHQEDTDAQLPGQPVPQPLSPMPMIPPPKVISDPPPPSEKEAPDASDHGPAVPEVIPEALEKVAPAPEAETTEEHVPEDLDAGLEEVVEWIDPPDDDTLEPDEIDVPATKPPDFLEPGF